MGCHRADRLETLACAFEEAPVGLALEQVLDLEIQEARALLRQRIGEEVRAERDFILDELQRVAAERVGAS